MGGALVGCLLLLDAPSRIPPAVDAPRSTRIVATLQGLVAPHAFAAPATPVAAPEQPAGPTVEEQWASVLSQDAWIHPLDGPARRMPKTDSRVFGADRPGDRPIECKHGHCGVDIGGEVWGEPVHAAHDGIVNRVQRGPNEDHGGQYVRIAHREGTVFTQYFHLAAIPRWIVVGKTIKAGDIVGLVGDTGVKISPAHLHFTVSVKPEANGPELYIDPEPLIALWPLRLPDAGGGKLSAAQAPGVVHGSVGSRRVAKSKRAAAAGTAAAASDAAESDSSNL